MPVVLDRFLYLTADKNRVVEADDPEAAYVLGGPGSSISDDEAERLRLEEYLKSKDTRPLTEEPDEEPKAARPPANKARRPGPNK